MQIKRVFRFLKSKKEDKKASLYCFLTGLIICMLMAVFLYPENITIDFLKTKISEDSKIQLELEEYSYTSKRFFVNIDEKNYSLVIFLDDLQKSERELKELNIELPNKELSWFQSQKYYYYSGVFFYLNLIFLLIFIKKEYQSFKDKKSGFDIEKIDVGFDKVAGIDSIKEDLEEVVEHFMNGEKVKEYGGKVLSGVILHGPPGTGKTLMAKAVAKESNAHFIAASGSQFVELYVGMGAKRVRSIFNEARKRKPCVIFIDEIDAVARKRTGNSGGSEEYDQTVNEFLAQMDGFKDNDGILVIGATNRLEQLDDAILRPGRFDRKINVDTPTLKGREEILNLYISKNKKIDKVDVKKLAKVTPRFSGADLKNLVDQAIYLAIKEKSKLVRENHFLVAKDKIELGGERDLDMTEEDKKITAYHEVGHMFLSYFYKVGKVEKVSIVPRGQALGVTQISNEESVSYSKDQLMGQLAMLLGGRVAEQIFFNHQSTGASNDIMKATGLARKMVCDWGMSSFGPINISNNMDKFSEKTKYEADQEIMKILKESEDKANKVLNENKNLVKKLSQELFERETLTSVELEKIIEEYEKKEAA